MPTFEIGLQDGRTLHIEATDQAAALDGVQHFLGNNKPAEASGSIDSLRQGASGVLGGAGKTLHDYLGPGPVGDALTSGAKAIAPANFVQPNIVDDSGFHPGNIPARLAQLAPGVAAQLLAAKLGGKFTGGSTAGKVLGAGGAGTLMSAGNEAQTAMDNQPGNTPGQAPNDAALARGAGVAVGENAVGALPLSRFVGGGSGAITPGLAGALAAAKKFSVNAGFNAAGSGASDVVHQLGQSVGTPGGLNVNLPEAADAAVSGGVMGGLLGAPTGARDLLNAKKFSAITPELTPAARQVANRAEDAQAGRNMDAGVIRTSGAQEVGADVAHKVSSGIHAELADAVKGLSTPLSPDAQNIITSTKAGRMPTDADYATLKSELANDPQAPSVLNLVQQAHVAKIVEGTGNLTGTRFSGGLAPALEGHLTLANAVKTAGVTALAGHAGHLITYSPELMVGLAGLSGLARLSDSVTGAGSPMGRFTRGFADDGATPVRSPVAPQAPVPGQPPVGPTGPAVAQAPTPWGPPPPAPPASFITPQQKQQMIMQANSPLRALAAQAGPNAMVRQAMPALQQLAAKNPSAPPAPAALNPLALPSSMTTPVSNIVKGWMNAQKMKATALGSQDAAAEVNKSPLIDQLVGGAENIPSPQMAKELRTAIGSAKALKAIQSDPEAEAIQAKADKAAAKAAAVPTIAKVSVDGQHVNVTNSAGEADPFPASRYAHLPPEAAGSAIARDFVNGGGKPNVSEKAIARGATTNVTNIRAATTRLTAAAPGLPADAVAKFEGRRTQADAAKYRDVLKAAFPHAAQALDTVFSDNAIKGIWTTKGK